MRKLPFFSAITEHAKTASPIHAIRTGECDYCESPAVEGRLFKPDVILFCELHRKRLVNTARIFLHNPSVALGNKLQKNA